MSAQIPLPIADRFRKSLEAASAEIRATMRKVAKATKQGERLARAANMDPGDLSKALAGDRDEKGRLIRKIDAAEALPAFFAEDEDRVLVRLLCRLCGGRFVEEPRLTAEQRFEIYQRAVAEAAPAVAEIAARRVRDEEGGGP